MSDFLRTAFNRRFVTIPIIAAICLITAVSYVTETRRSELMATAATISDAQDRMRILADLGYAAADVESEGRGYLLTRNAQFLEPYDQATARIAKSLKELDLAYPHDSKEAQQIDQIEQLISRKLIESRATLEAVRANGNAPDFIKQMRTVEGLFWMKEIRQRIELLRDQERQNVYNGVEAWRGKHQQAGTINVLSAIISAILLVITGVFITRDIERRNAAVHELDKVVEQRTRELSELSTHLQGVTEREKSQLARELHDELGGLLVSMKMDLMQLGKKLDLSHPDVKARWQRIQDAIAAGVELKRRVIEELRPTLLDNMGLIAALSWQAEQTCNRAGIALETDFPDEEPALNTDMAIAIFRVAQEAFTNMVKHSRASTVRIKLQIVNNELLLLIEDNGVGMPRQYTPPVGSHGLLSMRHRITAIGGSFSIGPHSPRGTQVMVRVPVKLEASADKLALRA